WENSPAEVTTLIYLFKIKPRAKILDLCCGPGRHAFELSPRGLSVVGVDRTKIYLDKARKHAETEGLKVEFIQEDMRNYCKPGTFDAVVNLFTSFGFFEDQREDELVLKNVYRSLKEGGVFVIDIIGKEVIARIFQERDWSEEDGVLFLEERKVTKDWSWLENRWILIKGEKREEFHFSHRPYSAVELVSLLQDSGFNTINIYGDLAGSPYDHKAKRLVAVAQK
ncbi:MAG: class I SAM-dependent methyltransferase, partial [Candidatus Zixiibacteriota bacterium]